MEDEEIKKKVREGYAKIVLTQSPCCGPQTSCCGPSNGNMAELISKNIGYSDEECSSVPDGANLGLGCGNPLAYAKLKEGDTVLDLGSGAGFDSFLSANKVGKTGKVIGVDMTPEMIAQARKNAEQGNYENVEFRLGEIENLPVEKETVDMVISNCVINLVPDKNRAFSEAFRVLKSGGILMVSDIVLLHELPEVIMKSIDAYIGCVAGASLKQDYVGSIRNAGFKDIKIHSMDAFPIDVTNYNSEIIEEIKGLGIPLEKLKELTQSVLSIKVEATKPSAEPEKILPLDKLKVDIYVPLNTCSCMWDNYMENVFKAMTPYIKYLNFKTKNVHSDEARANKVFGNCVVVDDKHKFTSSLSLKKQLPEILKQKGLIK